jgi:GNAT superfamily N-acetyltransferase
VSKPAKTSMDKVMENQEIAQEAPLAGEISLRRVGPADTPFLLELYGTTRQQELALVPWDEAQKSAFITMQFTAQQQHYANHYPHATHDVILRDGEPAGQIYVARDSEKIHIIDLVVAPLYRNGGIGTSLIQGLLEEARLAGVPVRTHVEQACPSLRLYQRLGFSCIEEVGLHSLLEWRPVAVSS